MNLFPRLAADSGERIVKTAIIVGIYRPFPDILQKKKMQILLTKRKICVTILEGNVLPIRNYRRNIFMKNQTTVMLPAINDVKNFVSEVTLCDYDVDLISGRYAVDAKSIMGIFSLDLSKPIKLEAQTDDASELFERIKQYIVE